LVKKYKGGVLESGRKLDGRTMQDNGNCTCEIYATNSVFG